MQLFSVISDKLEKGMVTYSRATPYCHYLWGMQHVQARSHNVVVFNISSIIKKERKQEFANVDHNRFKILVFIT